MGKAFDFPLHRVIFFLHGFQTLLRHKPDLVTSSGQTEIRVILSEQKPVFAA